MEAYLAGSGGGVWVGWGGGWEVACYCVIRGGVKLHGERKWMCEKIQDKSTCSPVPLLHDSMAEGKVVRGVGFDGRGMLCVCVCVCVW